MFLAVSRNREGRLKLLGDVALPLFSAELHAYLGVGVMHSEYGRGRGAV